MIKLIALISIIPALATAKPLILSWQDNSDNEKGFEMRGLLADGTWEVVAKTPPNITELEIDTENHEAWRVWAFNDFGYSPGLNNNVLAKITPADPSNLTPKKAPAYGKYERLPQRKDRG